MRPSIGPITRQRAIPSHRTRVSSHLSKRWRRGEAAYRGGTRGAHVRQRSKRANKPLRHPSIRPIDLHIAADQTYTPLHCVPSIPASPSLLPPPPAALVTELRIRMSASNIGNQLHECALRFACTNDVPVHTRSRARRFFVCFFARLEWSLRKQWLEMHTRAFLDISDGFVRDSCGFVGRVYLGRVLMHLRKVS